jgi:polyisoprenoid-binding protein YceI
MYRALITGAALALATPAFAAAPAWTIDPAQSSIGFTGQHAGAPFKGVFQKWRGDIRFDPADLATSKAVITIETGSAKTGDKFQETTLTEGEWFDSKKQPTATFATTAIRALGPGRYEADGTLTVKGKAVPVKLPFTLTVSGDVATMQGALNLDRTALNLGQKSDAAGDWVSKTIPVTIRVRATKAK